MQEKEIKGIKIRRTKTAIILDYRIVYVEIQKNLQTIKSIKCSKIPGHKVNTWKSIVCFYIQATIRKWHLKKYVAMKTSNTWE